MLKILIAPYAAKRRDGQPNAKNPSVRWWETVVRKLNEHGFDVIQIAGLGEDRIKGTSQFIVNWPLEKLKQVVNDCELFLSVESFLPHLCWTYKLKSGVVIFSVSSPDIFGHDMNTNVLKDRKYLREFQYQDWLSFDWNEDAFVTPDEVINAVKSHLAHSQSPNRATSISSCIQLAEQAKVTTTT